jgi:glyoxylate reductase
MEFLGQDIYGKTIGICGFGRIGRGVARRAMGFGMKVLYASRSRASESVEQEFRASYVDKQTLLRESDVVSLHLPLSPETRHYIGSREFALMKKTAILINVARGPVVDEKALVKALKARRIFAAGLDVYENEPALARGLAGLPNVVLTPHIGSASVETRLKMANMAVTNCIAGLTGQQPQNLLNPDAFKAS